jgi:hypothetical protein
MKKRDRELHVEKRIVYSIVVTDEYGTHDPWDMPSKEEAIAKADRLVRIELADIRGKDKL